MLFVLFELGAERYALDAGQVAEVLPLIHIRQIPHAPPGVAGVMNYRGVPVPVIDLSEMLLGHPTPRCLSTRIILVHYPDGSAVPRLLGLIAGKATETLRRDTKEFAESGICGTATSYLGPVATDARGLTQWVVVKNLLSAAVREVLFHQPLEQR